jgi:hypothetical protein
VPAPTHSGPVALARGFLTGGVPGVAPALTDALHATDAAVVVATHDRQLRRDIRTWPRLTLSPQGAPRREARSDR